MTARYFSFVMGEVFPADDPVAEWVITLALAMNDLTLVNAMSEKDEDQPDRSFYWARLALSHFAEAALFLEASREVPAVKSFVASLAPEALKHHAACLTAFDQRRDVLCGTPSARSATGRR